MIVAIPIKPPSTEIRRIAERHGFLTFPHFLDNGYIFEGKANLKWIRQNLEKYGYGLVRFAVAPDNMPEESKKLKNEWPGINWIYPLHNKEEDISDFEWIGFPHVKARRNYGLKTFLHITKGKKKWYLGFWGKTKPERVLLFNGFDTMIPYKHATKFATAWLTWGKYKEIGSLRITNNEIFEFNLISFKIAMKELEQCQAKRKTFSDFLGVEKP